MHDLTFFISFFLCKKRTHYFSQKPERYFQIMFFRLHLHRRHDKPLKEGIERNEEIEDSGLIQTRSDHSVVEEWSVAMKSTQTSRILNGKSFNVPLSDPDDRSVGLKSIWSYNTFGRTQEAKLEEYFNQEDDKSIITMKKRDILQEMDNLPGLLVDSFDDFSVESLDSSSRDIEYLRGYEVRLREQTKVSFGSFR